MTKSTKIVWSLNSLEAMLSYLKLFNDEGMLKLKKDELEHVRDGLHVTNMTKVVQALLRLDSGVGITMAIKLSYCDIVSHCFFFFPDIVSRGYIFQVEPPFWAYGVEVQGTRCYAGFIHINVYAV